MDIRFLASLIEVVEAGSIAAAARTQGITPAAVSQRIKALERDFGQRLLTRIAHKAQPTPACLHLLPKARLLVRDAQALKADLSPTHLIGKVRLGAISTALTGILPSTLKQLAEQAPDVKLTITPGTSAQLYQALNQQQLDAIICVKPPFKLPKYLQQNCIKKENLALISANTITGTTQHILRQNLYLRYDASAWGGRIAQAFLQDNNIAVEPYCDLDGLESIALLVAHGLGVSLVPLWSQLEFQRLALHYKVLDQHSYARELVFISHQGTAAPHLVNEIRRLIQTPDAN